MKSICLTLFLLLTAVTVSAQDQAFNIGTTTAIESTILNEKRTLNIYLPDGYSKDKTAHPVVYLLDGSANEDFLHIVGLVNFLTTIEKMPPSIVVGIANIDRKRDFTFPTTNEKDKKNFPTTGSSEKFIGFIEKELQPFIAHNYRTNESKTIIGQSLGGLLATEMLLKKPELFNNYLIVSPSLWWDDESLLAKAPELLKSQSDISRKVYISVGSEGKVMINDAKKLSEVVKASTQKGTQTFLVELPEENHATILHNAAYKGLELLNAKKS